MAFVGNELEFDGRWTPKWDAGVKSTSYNRYT